MEYVSWHVILVARHTANEAIQLNWIEDLGAEPILGIWSGISTQNYSDLTSWPIVPQDELQPYVDDAIAQIEFITANASTNKNAALRAQLGREEPFKLRFVEV